MLSSQRVKGPLAITRSKYDYAVGKIYFWAAGVANQVEFDLSLPRYAAISTAHFWALWVLHLLAIINQLIHSTQCGCEGPRILRSRSSFTLPPTFVETSAS